MLTEDFANTLLGYVLGPAGANWVSLHTAAPTTGDHHELPVANNYGRQPLTGIWSTPTAAASETTAALVFPTAAADWGVVTHVGVNDAETGGTLLMWGPLTAPKTINTGETIQFSAGQISVTVNG